jgi:hypothetical protein
MLRDLNGVLVGVISGIHAGGHAFKPLGWRPPFERAGQDLAAINRIRAGLGLPRFGQGTQPAQPSSPVQPPAQVLTPSERKGNILLPSGIPIFFLHGTFTSGDALQPLVQFVSNIQTTHPSYISYLPEVRDGMGIETVADPSQTVPAYKLAIREMGDFHYQIASLNLQRLRGVLAEPGTDTEKDERLARFFEILPEEAPTLLPLVKEYLAYRVFELPPEFKTGLPLSEIVSQRVMRLRQELGKLILSPEELQRPIIDTDFLRIKATLQGKELNLDLNKVEEDPQVLNLRSRITFKDIAVLEAYLMFLEKKLRQALERHYREQYRDELGAGLVQETAVHERARKTATKLMEKIAPQGMAFGHSQGGTVLMSALLNYLAKAPKEPEQAFLKNAPGAEELGARYIGIEMLFSSPLKGIPAEPAWGKTVTGAIEKWMFGPKKQSPMLQWVMKRILWRFFDHKRPAVHEMKENSSLMRKFQELLPLVRDQGVTVVSAHDVQDAFVEPAASLLNDAQGKAPRNVFNISLEAPMLQVPVEEGLNLIETEIRNQGLSPNAFAVRMLRWMPSKLKEAIFQSFLTVVSGLGQHAALVNHPDYVRKELGRKLIADPEMQTRLLDPSNFEPFRYQALVARGKSYQKNILDLPTAEAIRALSIFERQYPTFLPALIENAREWVPVRTSAANAACDILNRTLDLLEKAMNDPGLQQKYTYSIQRGLRLIAGAELPPLSKGMLSPSQRAQRILARFPEPAFR